MEEEKRRRGGLLAYNTTTTHYSPNKNINDNNLKHSIKSLLALLVARKRRQGSAPHPQMRCRWS
jgi:hypothetical protein